MIIKNLIYNILKETKSLSKGMAVPKKRRSKSKGKTHLSNWKKKSAKVAQKAFNTAKTIFAKQKRASEIEVIENETIDSKNIQDKTNE